MPQLSVVIATSRPRWLANCLNQFKSQSLGSLSVQLIVVVEGEEKYFSPVLEHHGVTAIYKDVQGRWGAFAKDVGLSRVEGDYVCFWDDDNIYYPHALTTLYAGALGYDLGIVRTHHMVGKFFELPCKREIEYGNIDTMCICVRSELAKQIRWSDHNDKGTDFAYVVKLIGLGATIRWVDLSIGEKLI